MKHRTEISDATAAYSSVVHSAVYPEARYSTVPVLDQNDPLEAYRACADGGLQAVPDAFATYIDHQQRGR